MKTHKCRLSLGGRPERDYLQAMRYLIVLFGLLVVTRANAESTPENQTVGFYYASCLAADAVIYRNAADLEPEGAACVHFFGGAVWAGVVINRDCVPAQRVGDLSRMFMIWASAQPERHGEHIVNALREILLCPESQ